MITFLTLYMIFNFILTFIIFNKFREQYPYDNSFLGAIVLGSVLSYLITSIISLPFNFIGNNELNTIDTTIELNNVRIDGNIISFNYLGHLGDYKYVEDELGRFTRRHSVYFEDELSKLVEREVNYNKGYKLWNPSYFFNEDKERDYKFYIINREILCIDE